MDVFCCVCLYVLPFVVLVFRDMGKLCQWDQPWGLFTWGRRQEFSLKNVANKNRMMDMTKTPFGLLFVCMVYSLTFKDGGSAYLWNIHKLLPDTWHQITEDCTLQSSPWELQILQPIRRDVGQPCIFRWWIWKFPWACIFVTAGHYKMMFPFGNIFL